MQTVSTPAATAALHTHRISLDDGQAQMMALFQHMMQTTSILQQGHVRKYARTYLLDALANRAICLQQRDDSLHCKQTPTGAPIRSSPIKPLLLSPSLSFPPTPPFRMIVSNFASMNTVPSLPLTWILLNSLPRMTRPFICRKQADKWNNFLTRPKHWRTVLTNPVTSPHFWFFITFTTLLRSLTTSNFMGECSLTGDYALNVGIWNLIFESSVR